jgi:hypothetical protein
VDAADVIEIRREIEGARVPAPATCAPPLVNASLTRIVGVSSAERELLSFIENDNRVLVKNRRPSGPAS